MRSWLNPVMNWSAPNSFFVDTDEYGRCIKNAGLRMPKKLLIILPCVHIHKPEQQFSKQIGSAACSSCLYFSNKTAMLAYARILTAVAWYFLFVFSLNSEKSLFFLAGRRPAMFGLQSLLLKLGDFFLSGLRPDIHQSFFFPSGLRPSILQLIFFFGASPRDFWMLQIGQRNGRSGLVRPLFFTFWPCGADWSEAAQVPRGLAFRARLYVYHSFF